MHILKTLPVTFILLLSSLYGANELRLTAEMESLATVHSCVNVLSGDFFLANPDLTISGPDPQHFTCCYDSGHFFVNQDRGFGMGCQFPILLQDMEIHNKKTGHTTLNLSEREGALIPYEGQFIHHAIKLSVDPKLFDYGYTNYSGGDISGRTNIKNRTVIYRDFKKHYRWGTFEITEGSGIKRIYRHFKTPYGGISWRLVQEVKPNGHKVHFDYWSDWLLKSVRTTNAAETLTYNTMKLSADGSHGYKVVASNGQKVSYTRQQFQGFYNSSYGPVECWTTHLTRADPSHGVPANYVISDNPNPGKYRQIEQVVRPDGRFLNITYGSSTGRVLSLFAPAGADQTPIRIASFSYAPGKTEILDAYHNKTVYHSQNRRLNAIGRYTKEGSVYSTQHFSWAESGPHKGNLIGRGLAQGSDSFLHYTTGAYDVFHNIIREELFGNLTGKSPETFTVSGNPPRPNQSIESYATHFVYSDDGFNLLLDERHPDGRSITYRYLPGTDLLVTKLTKHNDRILAREFHTYDDGLLASTVIDDGSSPDPEDLSHVTARKITRTTRRLERPAVGFPESTCETYLDLSSNQEYQLKRTDYFYDTFENLIREDAYDANNCFCYSLEYSYDDKGNLISQTDALGQRTHYGYDANKNRTSVVLEGSGFSTRYDYDFSNRLVKVDESHGDGSRFATTYRHDYLGNKIAEIDCYGNETRYAYDAFERLIEATNASGTIHKEYNALDQLIATVDQNGNRTTTTYNIRGAPVCVLYPDGMREDYQYNLNGTLAIKTDTTGLSHHYTYDGLNRVIQTDTCDASGAVQYTLTREYLGAHLISESDPMGNIIEYAYDSAGRKISEIKQTSKTTYAYDALGRLSITKTWHSPNDYIAHIQNYDLLDRIIENRSEDSFGNIFSKETYTYDRLGNCTSTKVYDTETTFAMTETHFNSRSLPIAQIDALGNLTRIDYNHGFITSEGKRVLQKTTTDALGNIQQETFDTLHRLVKLERRNSFGVTTALQQFCYDPVGNKIQQSDTVLIAGEPSHDYIIRFQYDNMGRLVNTTESGGDDAVKTTLQLYDQYGRLLTIVKPDGVTLHHTYNPLGCLETLTASDHTVSYFYQYDLNNNPTHIKDLLTGQVTTRRYDAFNQLTQETLGNELAVSYSYDCLGRLTKLQLPDGSAVAYSYDAAHLREVSRQNADGQTRYQHRYTAHDLRGNELQAELIGNVGIRTCAWDTLGRNILTQTHSYTERIPDQGYDPVGNLLCTCTQDPLGNITSRYVYNDLHQLVAEEGSISHCYAYDSINNRLQKDDACYSLSRLNQVTNDSEAIYRYDPNGNLIVKVLGNQETRFTYDALNRLLTAEVPGSWHAKYTYDSFGRRLTKTYDGNIQSYLYQGMREIGTSQGGIITQLRVLGTGKGAELGAAVAIELDGKFYAPIHDHRGNICNLVDSDTGEAAATYRYSAFGDLAESEGIACPWGFASKRLDQETGFLYFGKRYYSPHLGRWITPDPLGFADGPNLYAYVHNNPINLVDPWGLAGQDLFDRNKAGVSAGRRSNGPGVHGESQRPTNIAGCRGGTFGPPAPHSGDYSPVTNGLKGCAHSLCDFFVETCHGLETGLLHIGLGEMDCDLHDRCRMNDSISLAQANRSARIDAGIQSFLGVDLSDALYQQSRSYMTTGLQVASLSAGGYGAVKGLAYLHRMPMLSPTKTLQNLNRFHQNAYNLSKTAQNNIRILRGWAKSKGWERLPNPMGAPEKWGVYNANGKFDWHLSIKTEASLRAGLKEGSHLPRFDARLDTQGKQYINPFNGQTGGREVGRHVSLEEVW